MTVVPLETPVTNPVLLMVATPVLEETHGVTTAGVPEPFNWEVLPLQNVRLPVMVGFAFTVMVKVVVVAHCPIVGVNVYVVVVVLLKAGAHVPV
jgi:hypothetical protein